MAVMHRTEVFEFRATHRLEAGPRPEGPHGHRYLVEITLADAEPSPLGEIMRARVLPELHGRPVRVATPSTGERLVEWIDRRVRAEVGPRLVAVVLHETAKNRFVSALSEGRYV